MTKSTVCIENIFDVLDTGKLEILQQTNVITAEDSNYQENNFQTVKDRPISHSLRVSS